jgi:hypothetical protein
MFSGTPSGWCITKILYFDLQDTRAIEFLRGDIRYSPMHLRHRQLAQPVNKRSLKINSSFVA